MPLAPISRLRFTVLLVCFFLSGAAGLIYQLAWGKALGLIFGNTVYAISTVIAVFMGGLAFGSAWWGRRSGKQSNPVRTYGWMELGVGVTGAISLAGLAAVRKLYVASHPLAGGSASALLLLRFLGAAIVLFLPTFLMGGTLPVLVQGLTRQSDELGRRLSRLYWINTAGAVAGTLIGGFCLLATVGLRATVETAVAVNAIAGLIAVILASGFIGSVPEPVPPKPLPVAAAPSPLLLLIFGAVGATAIAYEVAWTRLLVTFFGSSTYAFTLMLATFLAGIVLGSLLFEWWVARGGSPGIGGFAFTQMLTAVAALGFLVVYEQLPAVVVHVLNWHYHWLPAWLVGPLGLRQNSFAALALAQFATSAAAMLPAATVFGFNFPLATVVIARRPGEDATAGASVGKAYAANTVGAIAGALLSGFFLIPWLGAYRLVGLAALLNIGLACLLLLRLPNRRILPGAAAIAVVCGIVFAMVSGRFHNPAIATFAPFLYYDPAKTRMTIAEWAESFDIPFAKDGLNAAVSVAAAEDYLSLRTNGKVDASNRDTQTQLFSGHLGAIFHPAPRRVLVVGFGSGMTVAALARYPEVERIDCVEIEPGIIEAAPLLEKLNRGVLRDPRVHVVLDDARNYLLTTRQFYDLIVSEPSNPWIAGIAALFTDEYYEAARSRLRPGGLLVQWIQGYSIFPEDLRMVLATVAAHFESVSVWRGAEPDFLLLARMDRSPLTLDRLRGFLQKPGFKGDFDELNVSVAEGVLAYHRLDDADLRRLVAGERHNTDDNTLLEFHAPRALLRHGLYENNVEMLWQARTSRLPRDVRVDDARAALLAAADTALWNEDWNRAATFLDGVTDSDAQVELLRGRLDFGRGDFSAAKSRYSAALRMDPKLTAAAQGLAEVARQNGDFDSAYLLYRQILARDPQNLPAMAGIVKLLDRRQEWAQAAVMLAKKLDLDADPDSSEFALLGDFFVHTGHPREAAAEYEEAIRRDPYSFFGHLGLGNIRRTQGRWEEARANYEFAERYDPESTPDLYVSLVDVYRHLGRESDARRTIRKAVRLFPGDSSISVLAGSM